MKYIDSHEFTAPANNAPIIDVRSPLEYEKGHINGAVNIPLFTDEERKEVGIAYKHRGRIDAIEKGLAYVGPKLIELAQRARQLYDARERKVYCWRGGMRSEKMSWLFETTGMECQILEGGYKAYRNQMISDFRNIKELFILHGLTGSGKTAILYELEKKGQQIIDLEKLAHHKGSAFGHIGMKEQPTSQQFQNDVHNALLKLDPQKPIWVECESLKIGNVNLPDSLWERMKTARVFEIAMDRTVRVERLVSEYGSLPLEDLSTSINKLSGQISQEKRNKAIHFLQKDNAAAAIEIILDYYDRTYSFTKKRFRNTSILSVNSHSGDANENANLLLMSMKKIHN